MSQRIVLGIRSGYGPMYDAIEILKDRGVFRDGEVTYRKSKRNQSDKFSHIDVMLIPYPDSGEFHICEYERIKDNLYIVTYDGDEGLFVEKFKLDKVRSRRGTLNLRALGESKYEYTSLEAHGYTGRGEGIERVISGQPLCASKAEEGSQGRASREAADSKHSGCGDMAGEGGISRSLRRRSFGHRDIKSESIRESGVSNCRNWARSRIDRNISRHEGKAVEGSGEGSSDTSKGD